MCCRWIPHNLTKAQKDACQLNSIMLMGAKKIIKKFNAGASKEVYKIITGDKSWIYGYEPEQKQQSAVWVFQNEPNPTKVVRARGALQNKWSPVFSGKLVMWQQYLCRSVKQ